MLAKDIKKFFEKYRNPIDFIKEYIGLIVVIPAALGGFWQLCELARISPSFIRFFSISQIVPDGLLILLIFILSILFLYFIIYLFSGIVKFNVKSTTTTEESIPTNSKKDRVLKITVFILSIIVFTFTIFGLYIELFFINTLFDDIVSVAIYLPMTLLMLVTLMVSIIWILEFLGANHDKVVNRIFPLLPFFLILIIFRFIPLFHSSFIIPQYLSNTKTLIQSKKISDNEFERSEIMYLNDKYIFIKKFNYYVTSKKDTIITNNIVILPFEKLLVD